jgi:hypothetical protein
MVFLLVLYDLRMSFAVNQKNSLGNKNTPLFSEVKWLYYLFLKKLFERENGMG